MMTHPVGDLKMKGYFRSPEGESLMTFWPSLVDEKIRLDWIKQVCDLEVILMREQWSQG